MAIYANFITGGVNNHTTTSEEANSFATDFVGAGVVGITSNTSGVAPMTGNLAVNAQGTPDMTVAVTAGQAYVTATPSGQGSQKVRVYMSANENVTIAANSSGSTKYDWVYLKVDAAKAAAPNLAGSDVASLVTSRSTSATTDDGTPPTYGIAIAVVTVANAASSITNGNIKDVRSQSLITYTSTNDTGWTTTRSAAALPTPNTVVYNGNRSYTLTFNSTDLTSYISNGMRLRTTRTVTAPTQCTSLNGTTQYWSKSSPTGVTFTSTFTAMGWVKINSYASSAIIGRDSAAAVSSGWELGFDTSGKVNVYARNATGNIVATSYQSIPLNKWVHIAASINASTGAMVIYMDGVVVPAVTSAAGTSIVQAATNLTIGNRNGATSSYFPGKIAQVALFSSILTQTTIQGYISQGISGSETNLVSAYSFNGNANDLNTTNANNLTANGSAVATNADSPFSVNSLDTATGSLDYGIVMSNTFSTNTTMVVQVPVGCTIPTSGGVSAIAYSTQKTPYGMPANADRWILEMINRVAQQTSYAAISTWYQATQFKLTAPIGQGMIEYSIIFQANSTVSGIRDVSLQLDSTAPTTSRDYSLQAALYSATGTQAKGTVNKSTLINLSSATDYYFYSLIVSATGTETFQLQTGYMRWTPATL